MSVSNKVALVTGGSRGIGAAIALRLAQDGADVAITYVSSPDKANEVVRVIESGGRRGLAIRADSADADAVKNAVRETVEQLGRLDVLVNNAGIAAWGTVDEFSIEEFDRIVAINIRAAFAATQEASRHLPTGGGGRVINVGSVTADRGFQPGLAFYGMTKAALAGLTRGFALDLASRAITVNVVQPGPVATDMMPDSAEFKNMVPLKRYGMPEEIASLVAYLASEESAFITGSTLSIGGGIQIA